ncbi:hypothetical protein [Pseudomonas nicosulfuronedens]
MQAHCPYSRRGTPPPVGLFDAERQAWRELDAKLQPFHQQAVDSVAQSQPRRHLLWWSGSSKPTSHCAKMHCQMFKLQDFTYAIAKRRSRGQWPQLVEERLRPDGPTTRLVDLEHVQGLKV